MVIRKTPSKKFIKKLLFFDYKKSIADEPTPHTFRLISLQLFTHSFRTQFQLFRLYIVWNHKGISNKTAYQDAWRRALVSLFLNLGSITRSFHLVCEGSCEDTFQTAHYQLRIDCCFSLNLLCLCSQYSI